MEGRPRTSRRAARRIRFTAPLEIEREGLIELHYGAGPPLGVGRWDSKRGRPAGPGRGGEAVP